MQLTHDKFLGLQVEPRVSPAVLLDARFLALSGAAVDAAIEDELAVNPAFEAISRPTCPACGCALARGRCRLCGATRRSSTAAVTSAATDIEAPVDARQMLLLELRAISPAALQPIAAFVVHSLDDHGLLSDISTADIADRLHVTTHDVVETIRLLRLIGPPAIGAETFQEALLLQLEGVTAEPTARLCRLLVLDHLPSVASGDLATIASATGTTEAEIEAAVVALKGLRPYPGLGLPEETAVSRAPPIGGPDIVVTRRPDRSFAVVIPESERWVARVDPRFDRLARQSTAPDEICAQVGHARELLERLQRRWRTLHRIAVAVVAEHADCLDRRSTGFRPIAQAEVALRLGLAPSTVSRAVRHRSVRLPWGEVVSAQRLFGTGHDVRAVLEDLLRQPGPRPTDRDLVGLLAEHGLQVARRTVAKYRVQVGFPRAGG